jgi:hypothetical protein
MKYRVSQNREIVLRDVQDPREEVGRLQEEGSNAKETSKASARDSHGLVGGTSDSCRRGGANGSAASTSWVDWGDGVGGSWAGGVVVHGGGGWGSTISHG